MPVRNCGREHHFVFGYGSLMCPQSRAVTAPTLATQQAQAVLARHVERTWTAHGSSLTYMGVQFKQGASCTGVVLAVSKQELAQFDQREGGYNRVLLDLQHVERVPFLDESNNHHDDNHVVFSNDKEKIKVWIYMQRHPVPADPSCPIAQSYVDIILRGCLSISEEFAQLFLETTVGWWHDGAHGNVKSLQPSSKGTVPKQDYHHHTWIDDRSCPKYVRADYHYSNRMASKPDELLRRYQRYALTKRRRLNSTHSM